MNEAPKPVLPPKKSNSLLIGIALLAAFPLFGVVSLLLRGNPCTTMLENEQALKLALQGDTAKAMSVRTSNSCSVSLKDSSGQVVLALQMRDLKAWEGWLNELQGKGFTATPLALGDSGQLYESATGDIAPASLPAEIVAEHVAGQSRHPSSPGQQSVALITAGPNVLRLIVKGPPERAHEVLDKIVAPQLQLLRDASF